MSEDRFIVDPPAPEIDTKKVIKILLEIKALKDTFPQIKIASRSNYEELQISNIKEQTNHSIQLKHERSAWKVVDHQLPIRVFEEAKSTNLLETLRAYMCLLDNLQPFYSSLQKLDEICVVGEPEVITSKTNWRLVKYSKRVFIKIEFINPLSIEDVSVTFHGCTGAVKDMTETYHSKCSDYDDESIYNKILNIFEIPYFPATDEDTIDCSICLSYRCEKNRCPIVCCDNEKCDSTFHISCLEKYFTSQKHVKILSICIGECPFCKQSLSNSYAPFFKKILASDEDEKKSME